ncbi:hypothetical protein [Amycolatopsis anabasis]|uniref:hypothetical protein n=1 Tax=Amycolatopsis anabasis TaxID=1840409 RepID=UPI00131C4FF7|nr:hypothetical protein [Amycolatopsis anabasis]
MRAWRRYLRNEMRTFASLGLLLGRRRNLAPGATEIGYAGAQRHLLLVTGVLTLVEGSLFLLVPFGPALHGLLLVLELYSVLLVLGVYAATVVRPHAVSTKDLHIRLGAFLDLRVPVRQVCAVHRKPENHQGKRMITLADGEFVLALNWETNLVVELSEPVTVTRPLGRTGTARVLKFYADDPAAGAAAIRDALAAQAR